MSRDSKAADPSALEVLTICEEAGYRNEGGDWVDLADELAASQAGSRLFTPLEMKDLRRALTTSEGSPRVEVVDATTQGAAAEFARDSDVTLLNFASGIHPGGGFLGGARAQEEDLCRCSALFPSLLTQPQYYEANRELHSAIYTDHLIYSPRVPFFRAESESTLLDLPYMVSVITTPAPNSRAYQPAQHEDRSVIPDTFERRWTNVLAVAREMGHRIVVLGAWGCGAFGNDPQLVAASAKKVLESGAFGEAFDRILFAIPSRWPRSRSNLDAFRRTFGQNGLQNSGKQNA